MPVDEISSSSTTSNNEVVKVEGNSAQEFSTDLLRLYYGNDLLFFLILVSHLNFSSFISL